MPSAKRFAGHRRWLSFRLFDGSGYPQLFRLANLALTEDYITGVACDHEVLIGFDNANHALAPFATNDCCMASVGRKIDLNTQVLQAATDFLSQPAGPLTNTAGKNQ